ncbi:hypothetical protein [Acinetobacter sp.]|uniref:hypothetical protein n=1 Tax=Acinetobacter sp. TaxID=472 RepID=UPI003D06DF24
MTYSPKKKNNDDGELLEVFAKGRGSRTEARLRMYNGKSYFELRDWIYKDGSWMKTPRGFMIPVDRRKEFVAFISKVTTILDSQGNLNSEGL